MTGSQLHRFILSNYQGLQACLDFHSSYLLLIQFSFPLAGLKDQDHRLFLAHPQFHLGHFLPIHYLRWRDLIL